MTAQEIHATLSNWTFPVTAREEQLQDAIEDVLRKEGIGYVREAGLGSAGRVDFLVEGVAVEVKIKGGSGDVLRQLYRYAGREEVTGILLITTKVSHVRGLPETMRGKPVWAVVVSYLGGM